jgi:uncharacterized protein YhfF
MMGNAEIEACWAAYVRSLPPGTAPQGYVDAAPFGSLGEDGLADELAGLVLGGTKTATSTVHRYYLEGGHPIERAGDRCIVLDADGRPRCVIEMTEIRTVPFGAIDAAFAADYGEGERTLPWWRKHLGAYYARHCAASGWQWGEETLLVCKRFRVTFRCP